MTRTEALMELIRLSERRREYWDKELPQRHPKWPLVQPGESSGPPPPEDAQIEKLLKSLPEDDLFLLCLLMYVGRGDFDIDHLKPGYQRIRDTFPSRDLAIDQILGKRALSEYLNDAWDQVQKSNINLDDPSFETLTIK